MRALWIVFIILIVLIVLVAGYVGFTVYQGYQLIDMINQEDLEKEFQAVEDGDCSRLPVVEARVEEVRVTVSESCDNTLLKWAIERKVPEYNVCEEVDSPDNDLDKILEDLRVKCA